MMLLSGQILSCLRVDMHAGWRDMFQPNRKVSRRGEGERKDRDED